MELLNLDRLVLRQMGMPHRLRAPQNLPLSEANDPKMKPPQSLIDQDKYGSQHRQFSEHKSMVPRESPIQTQLPSMRQKKGYQPLNHGNKEVRLLQLLPRSASSTMEGAFVTKPLGQCPPYTALSYTWGADEVEQNFILVDSCTLIPLRKNLFNFLSHQRSIIKEPTLYWIDAICIKQNDILERNHQVGIMKELYVNAFVVYIWLGESADASDIAMQWLSQRGSQRLRPRGCGFHPLWNGTIGEALVKLCSRKYWQRMWIIQELVHAQELIVWCGSKSVTWDVFETVYLNLKTLQDKSWIAHHEHTSGVLDSPAATMIWQRAHWRYADTPVPRLETLIETFQEWACNDKRDKVFALVSMASRDTVIEPDYSLTAREVYRELEKKLPNAEWKFKNLLSQLLGLSAEDIRLVQGQDL